jgi:hypothetical protein
MQPQCGREHWSARASPCSNLPAGRWPKTLNRQATSAIYRQPDRWEQLPHAPGVSTKTIQADGGFGNPQRTLRIPRCDESGRP